MSRRIRTLARNHPIAAFAGLLAIGLAFGLAGCEADSPSEPPQQQPGPPPGTGPGATAYNITLTLTPGEIPAGSVDPVRVLVQVQRADNGQPPPTGTTVILTASAGAFGTPDGPLSVVVDTVNGQALVSYFPPATVGAGSVVLQARLESSIGQAVLQISEPEEPPVPPTFFIASVTPSTGSPNGGEPVTIQGGGFDTPVRVTFGGVPAQVQSVTEERIRVLTPPAPQEVPVGGTLAVDVTVTINLNEEEQAVDSLPSAFIYARGGGGVSQPRVFSVSPASGPNEGGTRVTIVGEGFEAPVQVFFGDGTSADDFTGIEASVQSVSGNQIVVLSPSATGFGQNNQNQTVNLLVRNLASGFSTVAPSAFKYGSEVLITAVSPTKGDYRGGDRVTIHGQGFDEPVSVTFGGIEQDVLSVAGTEVIVRTAAVRVAECQVDEGEFSNNRGEVVLTNIETGDTTENNEFQAEFEFLIPQPIITRIAPTSGPQAGGTSVTISGQGFEPPVRVQFVSGEAFSGAVTSESSTQIVVTTPGVPNSVLDTESCDDNADSTIGERYVPTTFNVSVLNLLTGCSDVFAGAFTYIPTDQSCRGDVGPPPPPPPPPEADFDFTVSGLQVNFVDTSSGNPTSWSWQFGDPAGSTSTLQNPVFTYPAPGAYTVTLTIAAPGGSDSTAQVVTVP